MRSVVSCALLGLLLILGSALAGPAPVGKEAAGDKDKGTKAPSAADVTFADGSTMRVSVISESVELETKYGKLTIPAADVQRIEFAFRVPDDMAKKIKTAIQRLAENNFEERESATKELREIGLRAYPALEEAAKSKDAEVAKRAAGLLAEIREKVSADDLAFPKKDRVQTAEFTATGRILSTGLRVKTAYFGESDLKLADLRVFNSLGSSSGRKLTIDAAKYGSAAEQWMDTKIALERDEPLKITAGGQVDLWPQEPGGYMTSPKGYGNARPPSFSAGTLIGRIGESGTPFMIGEKFDGKANASGKLYLHITPSHWGNPSTGSYEVKVSGSER